MRDIGQERRGPARAVDVGNPPCDARRKLLEPFSQLAKFREADLTGWVLSGGQAELVVLGAHDRHLPAACVVDAWPAATRPCAGRVYDQGTSGIGSSVLLLNPKQHADSHHLTTLTGQLRLSRCRCDMGFTNGGEVSHGRIR